MLYLLVFLIFIVTLRIIYLPLRQPLTIFIILLLTFNPCFSQTEKIYLAEKNNLWGFINERGELASIVAVTKKIIKSLNPQSQFKKSFVSIKSKNQNLK